MTVKELIEELKNVDPETMVVVRGYEDGVDEVTSILQTRINLNVHPEWYYGDHQESDTGKVQAIYLQA